MARAKKLNNKQRYTIKVSVPTLEISDIIAESEEDAKMQAIQIMERKIYKRMECEIINKEMYIDPRW